MYAEHWVQCLCALGKIISLTNIISPRATEMVSATDNSEREGSGISLSVCVCVCVCVQLLRCIRFFATTWAIAHQASLSMEFSMPRILEWVAISYSGDLSDLGIEPTSPVSSFGQQSLYHCTTWEAKQLLKTVSYLSISHCHLHFSHPNPSHHYLLPKNTKVNIFLTGFPSSISAFYNLFSIHNKLLQT